MTATWILQLVIIARVLCTSLSSIRICNGLPAWRLQHSQRTLRLAESSNIHFFQIWADTSRLSAVWSGHTVKNSLDAIRKSLCSWRLPTRGLKTTFSHYFGHFPLFGAQKQMMYLAWTDTDLESEEQNHGPESRHIYGPSFVFALLVLCGIKIGLVNFKLLIKEWQHVFLSMFHKHLFLYAVDSECLFQLLLCEQNFRPNCRGANFASISLSISHTRMYVRMDTSSSKKETELHLPRTASWRQTWYIWHT